MVRALILGAMAFVVSVVVGRPLVEFLHRRGLGKEISSDGPPSHSTKAGTPTMGGVLIFAMALPITLAANIVDRLSILLPLGTIVAAGLLGLIDDLRTIVGRARTGLNKRLKVFLLTVLGLTAALVLYFALDVQDVGIPWAGEFDLGPGYIPLAVLIIVFTTTAVAITDGLDGLAGGTTALAFLAYGVIALLQEQTYLATFCFTVVGATAGFLWYNSYPAQVFMGDTGALALGSSLAVVALMTGHWLLLPIIGIVFVLEGLSDIIQIGFFRLTGGRRIFKMSPLHHHLELLGWSEPQVVMRFWLLGIVGCLLGVALASKV
ncbi:MAG: phospho-N-acetylmuramoyl-pentapeptide-transferase [Dehalococcoidia bacterium]|nr:MAG: phospho-N-acetylmuramoyl-pentapeptide-transferase [Dehalococcoidia bacterium]